jgi:hypothetical protein
MTKGNISKSRELLFNRDWEIAKATSTYLDTCKFKLKRLSLQPNYNYSCFENNS